MITKEESYYILKCYGTEQYWSQSNPEVLEKPKPCECYISSIDWAYQASSSRKDAWKFGNPPKINLSDVGPWWYKIDRIEVIKVERIVTEEDCVVAVYE